MARDIYSKFMDGPGLLQQIHGWPGTLTTHSWMVRDIDNTFMDGRKH
jgi:hypothetical protein